MKDVFWPLRTWPQWAIDSFLSGHLNNRERYNLFFFLAANGMEPELAGKMTSATDATRTAENTAVLLSSGYDNAAVHQMLVQLPQQASSGELFRGDKLMMDMTLGRVTRM